MAAAKNATPAPRKIASHIETSYSGGSIYCARHKRSMGREAHKNIEDV